MVSSLQTKGDTLRSFLYTWAAIEIFLSKKFGFYEERFFQEFDDGEHPDARHRYFERIRSVMTNRYRLTDKFGLIASYKEFMRAPGYESELDLVAEAPDGRFGAYCICWLDHANGVGLLEPVGTRPGFRRRVLARAVVLEGLRRMEARGAHTALVCFEGDNEPARGLYESVGFGVRSAIYTYTKDV